ncbi:MAG: TetR/AcrR family transcriptional regulator [Moorea sp. SIO3H5]|nr:TetR/AcrR family transcriptional regulator [Moorena sp. SIO3H5]
MARHKTFDPEDVLEKAMETFWLYGYEGTSMQDLVKTMGINRGSLYDTFGDKRSLFLAAIAHYNDTCVKNAIASLQAPTASKQAIIDFFYNLIEGAVDDKDHRGCLLTNTAVELCPHDPQTKSRIAANLRSVENAFKKALSTAREQGEITTNHDLQALAQYFTSSIQGLRVISKVNQDPETLRAIVKVILSVLD